MDTTDLDRLLSDENEHLDKLHQIVKDTLKAEQLIIHNLLHPPMEILTQGQKSLTRSRGLEEVGSLLFSLVSS
jgi:hypothetical protein